MGILLGWCVRAMLGDIFCFTMFHQGHACLGIVTYDDRSIHPILHICTPPKLPLLPAREAIGRV